MTIRDINNLIIEANSLKSVTEVFTQIASSKLKRIRDGVERNRAFFKDLSDIYGLVNLIARTRKIYPSAKNGKTLSIVLTSNERFYGQITSDLMEFFVVQTSKVRCEKLIIGKLGADTLKALNFALNYKTLILEKDFPNNTEFLKLSTLIGSYSRVLVFYPQFQSVLVQKPAIADITKSEENLGFKKGSPKELMRQINDFILEPEVKIMMNFFDNQIKVLLLEAAFSESELSRTASRLITMDNAQNEAKYYLNKQQILLHNAKRSIENARILETITAIRSRQA